MKNIILLLLIFALASCKGSYENIIQRHERIAQRKLRKALKHDPNIVQKQYLDTLIKGIAIGVRETKVDGIDIESALAYDSIVHELDVLQSKLGKGEQASVFLYKDSLTSISVKKTSANKLAVAFNVKPRIIHDTISIPYEVKVSVPGKIFKEKAKYPASSYWWFWVLTLISIATTFLWLNSIARKREITVIAPEKPIL